MTTRLGFSVLVLFLCAFPLIGQIKQSYDVLIDVDLKNKEVASTVESYISRELRSLADVNVVTKDPFCTLHIIGIENTSVGSSTVRGYTLSVVTVFHSPCTMYGKAQTCELFDGQSIYTDSPENLRTMCELIVTRFDTHSLKPLRAALTGGQH